MSLESLKKQAGRLAAYLGAHHKLRIKHSGALEAIAAAHGARNWATLAAQGGTVVPPDVVTPAGVNAKFSKPSRGESRPLVWHDEDDRSISISHADWSRHTLAEGAHFYTLAWLESHLVNCHRTFGCGVFINTVEDQRLPIILDFHRDTHESSPVPEYNLFAGLTVDETCDVLMKAYPPQADFAVRDFIRSRSRDVLKRILPTEIPAHESLTLSLIVLALQPESIILRMRQDADLAEQLRGIAKIATAGATSDESLKWAISQMFGPLIQQLKWLRQSKYGSALFSSKSFAQGSRSVVDCFVRGDLLHVTLPDDEGEAERLRKMWMEVMGLAAKRRRTTVGGPDKPAVLGIGRCKYFVGPVLTALVEQARSVDLALLLTTGSELELTRSPAGQRVLDGTYNHLTLGHPRKEVVEQVMRDLERSTAQLRSRTGTSFF